MSTLNASHGFWAVQQVVRSPKRELNLRLVLAAASICLKDLQSAGGVVVSRRS